MISHPTTKIALRANWWGLAGERLHNLFGRDDEVVSGIPGSETNHYGVPYSLTEEFVAVYRMHPLIPDDYSFRAAADDSAIREATFREIAGPYATGVMEEIPISDLLYSFGTIHPGVVTLHNFPRFLQQFERPDGHFQDLAATDILRSRELGVPRYNEFRRLLHLEPAESFDELTDNADWARQIERVYGGDIERVDLSVGMFAEPLPAGFAFSDTAFRIFVLMASRRLNSDRFFTVDYTPRVYAGRPRLDRRQRHDHSATAPLPEPAHRDARARERLPSVAIRGLYAASLRISSIEPRIASGFASSRSSSSTGRPPAARSASRMCSLPIQLCLRSSACWSEASRMSFASLVKGSRPRDGSRTGSPSTSPRRRSRSTP